MANSTNIMANSTNIRTNSTDIMANSINITTNSTNIMANQYIKDYKVGICRGEGRQSTVRGSTVNNEAINDQQ